MQPLVEQRMARADEHHLVSADGITTRPSTQLAEQRARLRGVERGQMSTAAASSPRTAPNSAAISSQNPADLVALARGRLGELVVELDHGEGLHEGRGAARRRVEEQALQADAGGRAHRHAVAVAPHRWRGVGDDVGVAAPDLLEAGEELDAQAGGRPPQARQVG